MLKGYAKIELTNVHTGEKEVVEKHNIVTNAIQDMLKQYGCYSPAVFYENKFTNQGGNNIPYMNFNILSCYGGIIAWDGTIEESKDNYKLKPYGVNAGAHAAVNVQNTTVDKLLGSYNSSESKIGETSAKFVYDFATNQGNGVISCITLVSQWLGYMGFNKIDSSLTSQSISVSQPYVNNRFLNKIPIISNNKLLDIPCLYNNRSNNFSVTIVEYDANLHNSVSLFKLATPTKVSEKTFSKSELCDYSNPVFTVFYSEPLYYDAKNNTLSVVLNNAQSPITELTIATINVLTYEVSKRKVTIPAYNSSNIVAFCYKNYLIFRGKDSNNWSIKDLTTGKISQNALQFYFNSVSAPWQITSVNDYELLLWGNYSSYDSSYYRYLINLKDATLINLAGSSMYIPVNSDYLPNSPLYFGTINNLSSPVVKTADKTMKITYTITEGE